MPGTVGVRGRWWLVVLVLVLTGCKSTPLRPGSDRVELQTEPTDPPSEPPEGLAARGPASGAALGPAGPNAHLARSRPRPARFSTIVPLAWNRFPDDRTVPCGRGKTHLLKPGRGVITHALRKASAGDRLLLAGGTYVEGAGDDHRGIYIDKDGIVIAAQPGQRARVVPLNAEVNQGVVIEASNVMVDGLDIEGFDSVSVSLGYDKPALSLKNIILSNLSIKAKPNDPAHDGIVAYMDATGQGRPAVDGLLVRNTTVRGANLGISCNSGPCHNWWLENVFVDCAPGSGSGADAIAVENGRNMVFNRVHVRGASGDGIDLKAELVVVRNSLVEHVARNGIKLWKGGDVINSVSDHTGADAAIVFEAAGRYRFLNSVVAYHNFRQGRSYGFTVGASNREVIQVELVNSVFYRLAGGLFFNETTRGVVDRCIFHEIETQVLLRTEKGGREIEYMVRGGVQRLQRAGIGRDVLLADPRFVNPGAGDFRLAPRSPAIDRGRKVDPFPTTDIVGAPRVAGKGPDIGAYERP